MNDEDTCDSDCRCNMPTWTTEELQRDFDVIAFGAPFVEVVRKADGKRGHMEFQHRPRIYFDFVEAS